MTVDIKTSDDMRRGWSAPYLASGKMPNQGGEVPSLDGLRAFSIITVLCAHFISTSLFPGGFGVLVFFVISGFLITRLLLAENKRDGSIALGTFYVRRLLRLYPVVLVYVAFIVALDLVRHHAIVFGEIAAVLLYYTNYAFAFINEHEPVTAPIGIFWSLAVEEHFYLVFPPLLVLCRGQPARLGVAMVGVMVLALVIRLWVAHEHPDYLTSFYFYFHSETRMDSLATGVLMAVLCDLPGGQRLLQRAARPAVLAGSVLAIGACFAVRDPWFRETVRYTVLNIAVGAVIAAILFSDRYPAVNMVLNRPIVVWIGRLSYSLYVWHLAVPFVFDLSGMSQPSRIALLLALSFAAALISYLVVERPMLAIRRRFGSVRREPPGVTA